MNQELQEIFNRFYSAYFISKAILEDYSEVVSKITDTDKEIIKQRILDSATKMLNETKRQ